MNVKVVSVGEKMVRERQTGFRWGLNELMVSQEWKKGGVWREEGQLDRVSSMHRGARPSDGGRSYLGTETSFMKGMEMGDHVTLREEHNHTLKNLKALQQGTQVTVCVNKLIG